MSDVTGAKVAKSLLLVAKRVEENKDYLCELDGEVGDGDHGVSMTIGMRAVTRAVNNLPDSVTPQAAFVAAADAYADEVGATIGPLYEAAFRAAAEAAKGKTNMNAIGDWAAVYEAMAVAIQVLGKAELGDKTLLDAFFPAVEHIKKLATGGGDLVSALESTAKCALDSAISTKDLVPQKGRAARLGDRAKGHQDAGATSLAIVLAGFAEAIKAG
ncbi:MAG: dihydroxyacetone kinase subunit DhaL [Actinobacteria bacterium]|jgi:dihydroxyacetone kinase-like protein|nr:dihydroxyacetone kinase subunit DhaL [Actinomycetota bacterium]